MPFRIHLHPAVWHLRAVGATAHTGVGGAVGVGLEVGAGAGARVRDVLVLVLVLVVLGCAIDAAVACTHGATYFALILQSAFLHVLDARVAESIGLVWNSHTEVAAVLAVTSTAVQASFSSQVAVQVANASYFVAGKRVSLVAVPWWLNVAAPFLSRQQPAFVSHTKGGASNTTSNSPGDRLQESASVDVYGISFVSDIVDV